MKTPINLFAAALLLASASSGLAVVRYVDVDSASSSAPYTSWASAATNIQAAVDASVAGDEIVVTDGIYASVAVNKPLTLRSVNGPEVTGIHGGLPYVRCVYLTSGASLSGFALTHGNSYGDGAGVFCESQTAVVSNCVVSGNGAYGASRGGGAYGGTLNNCTLSGNFSTGSPVTCRSYCTAGGGSFGSILNNCTLTGNWADFGGGAAESILNNCTLTTNYGGLGGGVSGCLLNNCTLIGNSAQYGGGAWTSTLNNCTLTGNFASVSGGGADGGTLNNCIVYFNTAPDGTNFGDIYPDRYGHEPTSLNWCCTTPQPTNGVGNITNAPLLVNQASGNLRLQSNSPCINAGLNAIAPSGLDLDGNPRIVGGSVDMGAYEFQSLSLISFGVVSNQFGFNVTGQSNWVIVLEASSDFTNWTALTTNTLSGSPFPFRDPTPPNLPTRFYRARME